MNTEHRARKQAIRSFMQNHYTDERLAQLLAHAQSGKLAWRSCCCFIGTVNAPHALRGELGVGLTEAPGFAHMVDASDLSGGVDANEAYRTLGSRASGFSVDDLRRRILIPMVRAEIARRDRIRAEQRVTASEEVFA